MCVLEHLCRKYTSDESAIAACILECRMADRNTVECARSYGRVTQPPESVDAGAKTIDAGPWLLVLIVVAIAVGLWFNYRGKAP